ncbi:MAG: permease [Deltaproteobacteria bacterium]|nr:permease [Deltaproteobacteria bacterium]
METFWVMLMEFAAELWKELVYILPYLGLGVLLEATIRTFGWHVKIRKVLTRFGVFAIPAAAALGVVSPLCACATLPLVISLLLAGLPLAPAMALLVTSPLMSPASYTMIAGMLGVGWANLVAGSALLLGLLAGYVTLLLRPFGFAEGDIFKQQLPAGNFHDEDYPVEELRCACGKQLSHRVDRCTHNRFLVFLAKLGEGAWKVGRFALVGLMVEVVATRFIPNAWVAELLSGDGIWPIFAITLASVPLHLPQVTAASMVFGFFLPDPGHAVPLAKGPGIALLIGGPVTALPVMGVFLTMFRRRVFFLYVAICVTGTLALALTLHFLPFTP